MNKTVRLIALLAVVVSLYGCELALVGAGAGIGMATYKYIEGAVEKDYPLAYNTAWDKTNTALSNLFISVTNSVNEGTKGRIESVRKDGTAVVVKLTDRGQGVSTISVRVGFGNRAEAERVHEEIKTLSGIK